MDQALTDNEVIGNIRKGDVASYEILAARYHRRLHRLAQNFLSNEADAQDVVQGAHLLALSHLDQYAGRSSYFSWMHSITANQACTEMRRRRGAPVMGMEHIDVFPSPTPSPEQQAIDREIGETVRAALGSLPSTYSQVFRLRRLKELTTAETGARLGLTEGCVKTRLSRARSFLRMKLTPQLSRPRFTGSARDCGCSISGAEAAGNRAGCMRQPSPTNMSSEGC